tara:strand:+ start:74 stop:1444 length:1371 start_codon:yes stop_codon:yes gene_type:complete
MPNTIVVLTYKSIDEIVLKETSESWKLNPIKASKCKYVICTRNRHDTRKIWHGKEKHREAFLIGKIKEIIKSPFGPGRYKIRFREYAEISIPEFWGKERNPIIYKDIDLDKLNVSNFKKVEEHKEGKVFKDRKEILKAGLHNNTVFGISQIQGVAKAVVLSGGYVDETYDRGEEVIYIGQGGRDEKTGKQTSNQSFENIFNKSLVFNCNWNIPVRVFRGSNLNSDYAPKNGYRYDGKYLINDFWYSQGVDGFKICNFKLVREENFVANEKTKYFKKEIPKEIFNNPSPIKLSDIDINKVAKKWKPKGGLNLEKKNQSKLELLEKATMQHEETVKIIAKKLKEKNLQHKGAQFDLYTELNGIGKLFEIKTWKSQNLKEQIRNGIIKLLEYKIRYQNEKILPERVEMYLALSSDPMKFMNKYSYLLDLMEDLNITLCWIDNKKVKTYNKLNKNINWIN